MQTETPCFTDSFVERLRLTPTKMPHASVTESINKLIQMQAEGIKTPEQERQAIETYRDFRLKLRQKVGTVTLEKMIHADLGEGAAKIFGAFAEELPIVHARPADPIIGIPPIQRWALEMLGHKFDQDSLDLEAAKWVGTYGNKLLEMVHRQPQAETHTTGMTR